MSSFICDICGISNIDNKQGYSSGCKHYPPDSSGFYSVKALNKNSEVYDTIAEYNSGWIGNIDIVEWFK